MEKKNKPLRDTNRGSLRTIRKGPIWLKIKLDDEFCRMVRDQSIKMSRIKFLHQVIWSPNYFSFVTSTVLSMYRVNHSHEKFRDAQSGVFRDKSYIFKSQEHPVCLDCFSNVSVCESISVVGEFLCVEI